MYHFGTNAFVSDVFIFRDVRNFFTSLSGIGEIGRVLERVSFSLCLPRLRVPDDGDLNTTSTLFFSLRAHLSFTLLLTDRLLSLSSHSYSQDVRDLLLLAAAL